MTLQTRLADLTTRIATEAKALRTLINGNAADLSALTTTAKTSIVAALNELQSEVTNAAGVSDATTTTSTTWSSQKISDSIAAAKAQILNSAPTALDTLDELAAALGDDANFAATVTTALGNRVRVDASQAFTAPQQLQGRSNIGAAASADLGNTDADLVAVFQAGLL